MTFRRKEHAKGGNGRISLGTYWIFPADGNRPVLRTVWNDNQGYFINFRRRRTVVALDADSAWHVVEEGDKKPL